MLARHRATAVMTRQPQVLVVGAGPAGLTVATALARHGVDVLVVERHPGTSPFPKATGVTTRTMELLRTWGVEQHIRAGAMPVRPQISVSDTLVGPELATESFDYPTEEEALAQSPVTPAYLPQDHLEPVLLEQLRAHGGRVRFHTELTDLTTGTAGVVAGLLDRRTGARSLVGARYLVGADGPRSTVRAALGIGFADLGAVGEWIAITFRADLRRRLPRIPGAINAVQTPAAAGLFVPTSNDDRWVYGRERPGGGPFAAADWTPERCRELLRAGTGLPDLEPRIESVLPFTMAGQVATALRNGPGFVVGDAAHRTTPMGGIGMNTAIHAAHNLGWKLAWVLRGWAGEALLDSYAAERLPVGRSNVERSLCLEHEARPAGLHRDLGMRYTSAVLDPGPGSGGRAPHAWLRNGAGMVSTIDLFDGRLTVLTGPAGAPWRQATAGLAATGLPITAVAIGTDLVPVDDAFAERYRLPDAGAVLVRPDGFVAWRQDHPGTDAGAALAAAVDRTLGRSAPARPVATVTAPARPAPPAAAARSVPRRHPSRPAPPRCRPAA
jgi:2-polyprenyl-6-methoxyphenol hydroxylase-like FAD-dependent oxidoreductase